MILYEIKIGFMKYSGFENEYHSKYVSIYQGDCMDLLRQTPDKYYSLSIIDPPYGLGNRLSDGGGKLKNTPMAVLYRDKDWDVLPSSEYWEQLFRVSKNQMVFGANYFLEFLPSSRCIVS